MSLKSGDAPRANSFLRDLSALGVQPGNQPVSEIFERLSALGSAKKQELLKRVITLLLDSTETRPDAVRIDLVKIFVGLLNTSKDALIQVLRHRRQRSDYDVHFTLFCYLDEIRGLPETQEVVDNIPAIIEAYLMEVEMSEPASMAATALGDNWNVDEAFPALQRVLSKAKYAAGRQGAIEGLAQAVDRLASPGDIWVLIERAADSDSDRGVRATARLCLKLGGQRPWL